MLELIFSLVIMGITLLSIPMIVQFSTQSTQTLFQQEAISTLSTTLHTALHTKQIATKDYPYFTLSQETSFLEEPLDYQKSHLTFNQPFTSTLYPSDIVQYSLTLTPTTHSPFQTPITLYGFSTQQISPIPITYLLP